MTVNSYLVSRASGAVLSTAELASITTSMKTIQTRLNNYFVDGLLVHFCFGSSTRGTILPRKMDSRSDIDYMIVFKDLGFAPQTYLNRLKAFVDYYYNTSEFKQSSPTIVLELNHIKFDLVPALPNIWGGYQIPNGSNGWRATEPNDFNNLLVAKNTNCHSLIKPTIRLLKYWNALCGYVYDSYALEKWVIEQNYYGASTQRDYLFQAFDKFNVPTDTQWRKSAVERAKKIVGETRALEAAGFLHLSESEIKKLIPET